MLINQELIGIVNQIKTATNHGLLKDMDAQKILDFCLEDMRQGDQAYFRVSGLDPQKVKKVVSILLKRGFVTYLSSDKLSVFLKTKVSSVIVADQKDYVYDPDHKKNPVGGGWRKTDAGWTRKESLSKDDEFTEIKKHHEEIAQFRRNLYKLRDLPSFRRGNRKLNDLRVKTHENPEAFYSEVSINSIGLTPTEIKVSKEFYRMKALEYAKRVISVNDEIKVNPNEELKKQHAELIRVLPLAIKAFKALSKAEKIKIQKPKVIQPQTKALPAFPERTYDFSSETYYASHPEQKAAIDPVMKEVEELVRLEKADDKFRGERSQRVEKAKEKIRSLFREKGVDLSTKLSPENQEIANKIFLDEDAEANAVSVAYFYLKRKIKKDIGEILPSFYVGYYNNAEDLQKNIKEIPARHYGREITEKVKQSPKVEIPESGTYVAISDNGGFGFYQFDRTTASGLIRAKNLFSGNDKNISQKEWKSLKENARLLTPELAHEGKMFMEYVNKNNSKN